VVADHCTPGATQLSPRMSIANPLWGAPRIQESFAQARPSNRATSVGPSIGQATKPAVPRMESILSTIMSDGSPRLDRFVVPTISFSLLYGLA